MGRLGWEPSVYTEKAGGEVLGEGQGGGSGEANTLR